MRCLHEAIVAAIASCKHRISDHAFLWPAIYNITAQLNSTQLNRELRTQVSNTSKSASISLSIVNERYHFMTSPDRFPVPVRSAVKSNLTVCCCQNVSKRALNASVNN